MQAAEDAPPEGKRDVRDFALWKGHKAGEPDTASWPTPWGRGRPGWHLECSAMAEKYLGAEFDIHGGGLDLRFPHHENEQAQSRAAGHSFARTWMHNAMLNLGGSKMAKSVGNTLLVSEVVKRVPPIALRYYLVAAHYRSIVEFSEEALLEAATAFERIEGFVDAGDRADRRRRRGQRHPVRRVRRGHGRRPLHAGGLAAIQGVIAEGNKLLADGDSDALRGDLASVRAMLDVLGLDPLPEPWVGTGGSADAALDSLVQALIAQREEARAAKDFATADRVRDQLADAGIEVEDTAQGARWTLSGRPRPGTPAGEGS